MLVLPAESTGFRWCSFHCSATEPLSPPFTEPVPACHQLTTTIVCYISPGCSERLTVARRFANTLYLMRLSTRRNLSRWSHIHLLALQSAEQLRLQTVSVDSLQPKDLLRKRSTPHHGDFGERRYRRIHVSLLGSASTLSNRI